MSDRPTRPARVLLGDLEPITRLGMSRLLVEAGVEVLPVEDGAAAIVAQAGRLAPDAVVLALEGEGADELGRRVRAVAPEAKVILWSRDETRMHVLDPAGSPPQRVLDAVPDVLIHELAELSSRI
jgi:DNA-binding NarL/FixJ family response regulator